MNGHVILYWHYKAWSAKKHGRWVAYEFYRQWHTDELNSRWATKCLHTSAHSSS